MTTIEDKVRTLPPDVRQEVEDFIEFLLAKRNSKKGRSVKQEKRPRHIPGFGWAGALSDMGKQYASVNLQHEISAQRAASSFSAPNADQGSDAGK